MAVKYTIQGRLDGFNKYTGACRANPYKGAKLKKDNQRICKYNVPLWLRKRKIKFPVIVEITWYEKDRRRDPDNIASAKKYILDSLVELGVFPNDGQKQIIGLVDWFEVDKRNPRIEVTIYEETEVKEVKNGHKY